MTMFTTKKLKLLAEKIRKKEMGSVKRQRLHYFLLYSTIMLILGVLVFLPFLQEKRSLVWIPDALDQHLVTLQYHAAWLKDTVRTLFTTGQFNPAMYDFNIGVGGDIFTSLSFYTIGDPLNIFSVFVPENQIETFYIFMIFLRLFLSGISFSAFCFYLKKSRYQTLIGALVYVFGGYGLQVSIRHPFFILGMIYLPLLLIGVEKIFRKEKPTFFVVMVFVMAISNFYFLYILTLLLLTYAVIRFFHYVKENRLKLFGSWFLKFLLYYLLGILLAAFILFPVIHGFLSNGRIGNGGSQKDLLFLSLNNYVKTISGMFNTGSNLISVIPLCLFSLILLFVNRTKQNKSLRWAVAICFVFAFVPLFGYIFNCFNYVSNRWTFAFVFAMAFALTEMLPQIAKVKPRLIGFVFLLVISVRQVYILAKVKDLGDMQVAFASMIFTIFAVFILYLYRTSRFKKTYSIFFKAVTCLVVCVTILLGSYSKYSPKTLNYVSEFTPLTNPPASVQAFENFPAHMTEKIHDDNFYRVDMYREENERFNTPMVYGYNGLSAYLSTAEGNFFSFCSMFNAVSRNQTPSVYNGFGGRTALNALSSVKYFVADESKSAHAPFGYEKIDSRRRADAVRLAEKKDVDDVVDDLYINRYALPIGYTYNKYITTENLEKLPPAERQQAMLQGAVVDKPLEGYKELDYTPETVKLDYTISNLDGVKQKGEKKFTVKKNGTMTISFKGLPNSETYLCFDNMQITKMESARNRITATSGEVSDYFMMMGKKKNFYCGIHSFILNMGYNEEPITECSLTFSRAGTVTFDDFTVISVPMDTFPKRIEALREETLENVKMEQDRISGNITLKENKILQLSIPYNKGWRAFVDGKEVTMQKSNVMYMSIPLKAGAHDIVLEYKNASLFPGFIISLITLAGCGVFSGIKRNKREKRMAKQT